MIDQKFRSRFHFRFCLPLFFVAMASLSSALAQPDESAVADRSASVSALKDAAAQILNSGLTPRQQVARMAALREEQMKLVPAPQAEAGPSPSAARTTAPRTQVEENLAALRETQAAARTPEEAVRLQGKLFRLNADAYALPTPKGDRQSLLAARASLSGQHGSVAESRDAILEILSTARTPEESTRLMDQFFTLNRETLLSLVVSQPDSTTLRPK